MPSLHPIDPGRKVLDRERAIQSGQGIIGIVDRDAMALHKGMHAALHRDLSPHTGKFDHVGCSRLRQRRAMKHDEDMLIVPLVDLKIMGHRIQVRHGYLMMIAYDRYERHKLADVGFKFGLFKDKGFARPNSLNHDHNILEPAATRSSSQAEPHL